MKFSDTFGNEQIKMIKFLWRSRSGIRVQIHIVTLIRCALAEVCTVAVHLVTFRVSKASNNMYNHLSLQPEKVLHFLLQLRAVPWYWPAMTKLFHLEG